MALLKLCSCGKAIPYTQKRCDSCQAKWEERQRERNKQYDKEVRYNEENKMYTDFYHSKEWELLRESVLSYYNGLDVYQLMVNNRIEYANTVHHIEELKDNWSMRLSFNNQFPCSLETHSLLHQMYKKDKVSTQKMLKELLIKWNKIYKE